MWTNIRTTFLVTTWPTSYAILIIAIESWKWVSIKWNLVRAQKHWIIVTKACWWHGIMPMYWYKYVVEKTLVQLVSWWRSTRYNRDSSGIHHLCQSCEFKLCTMTFFSKESPNPRVVQNFHQHTQLIKKLMSSELILFECHRTLHLIKDEVKVPWVTIYIEQPH